MRILGLPLSRFLTCSLSGLCGVLLLLGTTARAAFVYETPTEFFTSGYFNSDTNADVLVLDKATGVARVGYQDGAGALGWTTPFSTGVENITGCAVGRFVQGSRDNFAVTSTDYNRVPVFDVVSGSTAYVVTPVGIGPYTLVGMARAQVPPFTTRDMLVTASAFNSPPAARLELIGFTPPPIVATTFGPYNETGLFERGNELQLATNGATFATGIVRGDTNDSLHIWQFTNSASIIGGLSNLPPGSGYVFGKFDGQALPHFWFFVPGQSNVTIRPLISSGGGFDFGTAISLSFTQAVQNIYYVRKDADGSALIQFGDGIQGARLPGGSPQLAAKYAAGGGASGDVFTGIAELDNGKFALFSAPTGTVSSLRAQVMTFDGTNYTQISSNNLPAVSTRDTRATVWLFQSEPFTNTAATLIASLSVPDWSSGVTGLPGSLSVRAENDAGAASGLGSPATNNLGVPPAGTTYALSDQYRDDISFFTYAPPRPAEPVVITIAPPPGAYGGPIQISFIKQNAAHQVFYRTGMADAWKLYAAPFALTNDATIQYYGSISGSTRGRLQFASYTMGRTNIPGSTPVTVPGSDTNPPPTLNPNATRISANGTVFYGRNGSTNIPAIWAIDLDGSSDTRVTSGLRPRVSLDGRYMSFLRENDPATNQFSLWVRDLATGQEERRHSSSNRYVGHDWTPDNTNIVFDNNCLFWRIGLSGSATQLPLPSDCRQAAPSVNPLDGRLAFQIIFPGSTGLYLAPPDATSKQRLNLSVLSPRWPAWSPGGQHIAIADDPNISQVIDAGHDLWVVGLGAQTNAYRITTLSGNSAFPNGAVWTPGGNKLVSAGRLGGTNGLWVIPLTPDLTACAAPPQRLPTSPGDDIDFAGGVVATSVSVSYADLGLFIRLAPSTVVVYWSTNYDGFTLESVANLPAGLVWTPVTGPYFRAGPYFEYRESRAALQTQKFFRLHYPGVLVLTPPEPEMVFRLEPNAAVLNWPLNYVGYTLEATTNLSPPVLWTPMNGPYLNTNGVFEYRRTLPGPPREFYRLRWP